MPGVSCWGSNAYGQLGDGTLINRSMPVPVAGLPPVKSLTASYAMTCATAVDAGVWCWGLDSIPLGRAPFHWSRRPLVEQLPIGAAEDFKATHMNAFLLRRGTVLGWGENLNAELGAGGVGARPNPGVVQTEVQQVAAGATHTCALRNGEAWCWGAWTGLPVPEGVFPSRVLLPARPTLLTAGDGRTCATLEDHTLWCWGGNEWGQLGIGVISPPTMGSEPPTLVPLADVASASASHHYAGPTCARLTTGQVWCWGTVLRGSLGDGVTLSSGAPRRVPGADDTVELAAGGGGCLEPGFLPDGGELITIDQQQFVCALRSDGGVRCWGDNHEGQLGDGTTQVRATPVDVVY